MFWISILSCVQFELVAKCVLVQFDVNVQVSPHTSPEGDARQKKAKNKYCNLQQLTRYTCNASHTCIPHIAVNVNLNNLLCLKELRGVRRVQAEVLVHRSRHRQEHRRFLIDLCTKLLTDVHISHVQVYKSKLFWNRSWNDGKIVARNI